MRVQRHLSWDCSPVHLGLKYKMGPFQDGEVYFSSSQWLRIEQTGAGNRLHPATKKLPCHSEAALHSHRLSQYKMIFNMHPA